VFKMVGGIFLAHQQEEPCPKCGSKDIYHKLCYESRHPKICGDCFHKWEEKVDTRILKYR